MRVLAAHLIAIPELQSRSALPGRTACEDEILALGSGYPEFAYRPGMPWNEILSGCSRGWKPDVYIHVSPEYNPIPEGLENAECLTVGLFGDWNLGGQAIHYAAGAFDMLYADHKGCERLRRAGFQNAGYTKMWAQDPSKHRVMPGIERDIDVLMIGNFNHNIQWERAPWLARVAGLSRKYTVQVTCGVWDEQYVQLMNRAKIVFNRSIRGEMNMRAFEAPACGALLFYEAENPEVRQIFTDRQDCVLYTAENLELLLDYYLAPEHTIERMQIAEAGRRTVQKHSYAHHFGELLSTIETRAADRSANARRRSSAASSRRRRTADLVSQWLLTANGHCMPRAHALLNEISNLPAAPSVERNASSAGTAELSPQELANLRGVLYAEWAAAAVRPDESRVLFTTALNCLRDAVSGRRDYLTARCNLAYLLLSRGEHREATALLEAVLLEMEAGSVRPDQMAGLWYPRKIDYFGVGLERVWNEYEPGTDAWLEGILALVCGRICVTLAELRLHENASASALPFAAGAVRYAPQWSESHYLHAHLLARNGRVEEALDAYRESLRRNPFFIAPREELVRVLLETGQKRAARAVCTEWLAILDGCPPYESTRGMFAALLSQACETQPDSSQDCLPGGAARSRPLIYC